MASPILAAALAVQHDATVGYWKPEPLSDDKLPKTPESVAGLSYLSMERRSQVLIGHLLGRFTVERGSAANSHPGADTVLLLDGNPLCSITKPTTRELDAQIIWLRNYADLRGDRIPEITVQTDGILSFYAGLAHLNMSRRKKTLELLSLLQNLTINLEMRVKHFCWSPRPIDFAPEVQPIIQTPDHSTFPSGHATEAFAIATALVGLMPRSAGRSLPLPYRIAHRIAVNRTIAGVHFPVDSAAGAILGVTIAEAVLALLKGGHTYAREYGETLRLKAAPEDDFTQTWFGANMAGVQSDAPVGQDDLLGKLWSAIEAEWP